MTNEKKAIIQEANIQYHTQLADKYDQQPYFKPENVSQVKKRMEKFARSTNGKRLLDIGCGTGFILSLAYEYFEEVYGIDITPKMIEKAINKFEDQKIENVKILNASSDELPFNDSYFDVVTAYTFLHHLPSLPPTFKEVYRVLKNGGIFYADLDPNFYFWESMKSLPSDVKGISPLLENERKSVCDITEEMQNLSDGDLDCNTIEMAEYLKTQGGFKEENIKKLLLDAGFKDICYKYTWYWQEGKVISDLSLDAAQYFENHLCAALPLTRSFFKYIRIEARK